MNETCETKESCIEKMKLRVKGSIFQIIGAIVGGLLGFIYYYKVGCTSGSCPITSNPWLSILWGTIMGYLLVDLLTPKRK